MDRFLGYSRCAAGGLGPLWSAWRWDGHAHVWVPGAWVLPPHRHAHPPVYLALKRNSVVVSYFSPGFNSAEGNDGLLGVSGKCCVSRHRAACWVANLPPVTFALPSRKLPV